MELLRCCLALILLPAAACTAAFAAEATTAAATTTENAPIEAGLAVADVTPPLGWRMSGYFSERLSTGTHDPLLAKVVVFRQGDRQAAMVFCDLIGVSLDISTSICRAIETATGIPADDVLIAATHSHTGPLYFGALRRQFHDRAVAGGGPDPHEPIDYAALLSERIVQAVAKARKAAAPVELHAGVAQQQGLSFNRRFYMKDGPVRFNPGKLNPNIIRPAGSIDPDVGIVLLRRAQDDRPLGALTVFALHLDTIGGTEYAADYPYYLAESLKDQWGQSFVSLFGNGTCGDINHIDVSNNLPQKGHVEAQRIGRRLAETVQAKLPDLPAVERPSLAVRKRVVDVPLQTFTEEQIAEAQRMMQQVDRGDVPFLDRVRAYATMSTLSRGSPTLPMTVQVFRLSDDVALVALPGEVFVDLGLAIKRASPFATTLVVELAHDAPGYVPTRKAFAEGSYETVNSRIAPGGGEMLVDAAVELLKQVR